MDYRRAREYRKEREREMKDYRKDPNRIDLDDTVTPCLTKAQKTSRNADGNISAVSPHRDTYPLSFLSFLFASSLSLSIERSARSFHRGIFRRIDAVNRCFR